MKKANTINCEIRTRIAKLFLTYLLPLFTTLIVIGVPAAIYPRFQPTRLVTTLFALFLMMIPSFLYLKRKYYQSLKSLIVLIHLPILMGTLMNNGIEAPIYMVFMISLVLIGWIASSRQTITYTILFLSYGLLLVTLHHYKLLPMRERPPQLALYIYYTVYFCCVAIATILGNKLLHKTLRESDAKKRLLSTTFSAIPDALMILTDSYAVLESNKKAEELCTHFFESPNSTHLSMLTFESNEVGRKKLIELLKEKGNKIHGIRLRFVGKRKKEWYSISASPLIFEDESTGVVLIIRDITSEVEQEYNLIQAQKMDAMGQLSSGIAHDFNNMLGGIQGATNVLQLSAREDQNEMLNLILNASDKASKLTNELLVFSRKTPQASTAIEVHTIIDETVFLLSRTIDKRITIKKELSASSSLVVGDDTLIQSALMNMGINASHAMPDGGTLTIKTIEKELDELYCKHSEFEVTPGNYLSIEVIDSGCGMPPEVQKHIFEPFFTTKEVGKGTGLGMAAVYSMIVKHKGAIRVYSEEGTGTAFHILLPLVEKSDRPLKRVDETIRTGTGSVLVVDDEEFIRITTTELLRSLGYTVYAAQNGEEALALLQELSVDVILLDMIMPKLNGRQTFEKIIEQKLSSAKVILSSGFSKEEDVIKMREKGLFGFLHKPYQRSELSQMVADAAATKEEE